MKKHIGTLLIISTLSLHHQNWTMQTRIISTISPQIQTQKTTTSLYQKFMPKIVSQSINYGTETIRQTFRPWESTFYKKVFKPIDEGSGIQTKQDQLNWVHDQLKPATQHSYDIQDDQPSISKEQSSKSPDYFNPSAMKRMQRYQRIFQNRLQRELHSENDHEFVNYDNHIPEGHYY